MIETPRLQIIPCDDTIFDAIKMGNNILSVVLGVNVPKKWTDIRDTFSHAAKQWKAEPALHAWWLHLIIFKEQNLLIGTCGFKGAPSEEGEVEIAYEIREEQREIGIGTEVAEALVKYAFADSRVKKIIATTYPIENASGAVLQKVGFQKITQEFDDTIWRWELIR